MKEPYPKVQTEILDFLNAFYFILFTSVKSVRAFAYFFNNQHLQISMFRYGFNNAGTWQLLQTLRSSDDYPHSEISSGC